MLKHKLALRLTIIFIWAPGRAMHYNLFFAADDKKKDFPVRTGSSRRAFLSPSEPVHPGGPGASVLSVFAYYEQFLQRIKRVFKLAVTGQTRGSDRLLAHAFFHSTSIILSWIISSN